MKLSIRGLLVIAFLSIFFGTILDISFADNVNQVQIKEKAMKNIKLKDLNVVGIYVENLDEALKFYVELLGMKKIRKLGSGWLLRADGLVNGDLSIYIEGGRKRTNPNTDPLTESGLTLCFSTVEGIKNTYEKLKAANVKMVGEYQDYGEEYHMFSCVDPSGNIIEFSGNGNPVENKSSDAKNPPKPRFVIFHSPGKNWPEKGLSLDHPIVKEHAGYFAELKKQGLIERGGPFPGKAGGMMIFRPGLEEEQIEKIAKKDPGVVKGILQFQLKPWIDIFGE